MRVFKPVILLLMITVVFSGALPALVIKIGSIAPDRSPWDKGLEELSREWEKITNGQVKLKIYPGGIAGNEEDMIRKMRVGILGGAGLTNMGMTHIYSDIFVLNLPFQFTSEKEFEYVLEKMRSHFEKGIEAEGFKLLIWSESGWVNFFTKNPVFYPDDLKKYKISFTTGMPKMEQAWKITGFQVIPNDLKDLLMALQSGMVDAFYLPPLIAGSGQYFPLAPHMCSLKVAPIIGGIVITNRVWNQVPEPFKKSMLDATNRLAASLRIKIRKLEKETLETMIENGLVINQVQPDAVEKWREAPAKGIEYLIGKSFSKETYDQVQAYLKEYRDRNAAGKNK